MVTTFLCGRGTLPFYILSNVLKCTLGFFWLRLERATPPPPRRDAVRKELLFWKEKNVLELQEEVAVTQRYIHPSFKCFVNLTSNLAKLFSIPAFRQEAEKLLEVET